MVELLAPAGNPEALEAAIAEGADAVYLGLKSFNARMRSSNFAWNQFEATVDVLHQRNKKIYVTVNTVVTENEMERLYRFLAYLNNVGPDGIIVQDLGLIQMAHKHFPNLKLHASTQLNIASAKAANAMSRWGVSRTVLARELSLEEIRAVHANTSCELEVFAWTSRISSKLSSRASTVREIPQRLIVFAAFALAILSCVEAWSLRFGKCLCAI